jgi:hypothetical protein
MIICEDESENQIYSKIAQKVVKETQISELKEIELTFLRKDCQCRIRELLDGIKDDEKDLDLKSDVINEVSFNVKSKKKSSRIIKMIDQDD